MSDRNQARTNAGDVTGTSGTAAPALALTPRSSVALDALRGIAAQCVLIGHGVNVFGISDVTWLQNMAVAFFFVISGLLISYSTLKKADRDPHFGPWHFGIERFSRIYSCLVPCLIAIAALDGVSRCLHPQRYAYGMAFNLYTFAGNLLMLQDHCVLHKALGWAHSSSWAVTSFGSGRILWTLAIEWWIYLAFGWALLARRTRWPAFLRHGLLFCLALVPLHNLAGGRGNGLTLAWLMGLGVFLFLLHVPNRQSSATLFAFLGGALAASALRLYRTGDAYDPLVYAPGTIALLCLLYVTQRSNWIEKGLIARGFRLQAKLSYALYLVHFSVMDLAAPFLGPLSGWTLFGLCLIASNAIALLMAALFESRHRAIAAYLKRRLLT